MSYRIYYQTVNYSLDDRNYIQSEIVDINCLEGETFDELTRMIRNFIKASAARNALEFIRTNYVTAQHIYDRFEDDGNNFKFGKYDPYSEIEFITPIIELDELNEIGPKAYNNLYGSELSIYFKNYADHERFRDNKEKEKENLKKEKLERELYESLKKKFEG